MSDPAPKPSLDPEHGASAGLDAGGSEPSLVVGVGASAGGVAALKAFLAGLPPSPGMAFIVIVHLDPERESQMAEILQASTSMRVEQVRGRVPLRENVVYVIPPGRGLALDDGHVTTEKLEGSRWKRLPIDTFFRSLSGRGEQAVAVVLSGTGTDGTLGIRTVKENGGLVLVQDPDDAEHEGMPTSALQGGHADMVLAAGELGPALMQFAKHRARVRLPDSVENLAQDDLEALLQVLGQLRARTGHDFSRYKRSTLLRRVGRRMQVSGAASFADYLRVMGTRPPEAQLLLKDLLISVTSFFRDPEVWTAIEREIVPLLFDRRRGEPSVRVWVPACATGEEAYTIAMIMMAHASTLDAPPEVQVFASDVDESALTIGRAGVYPEAIAGDVPASYLERFFTSVGSSYHVDREVRERILFATHSLFRNPPFSRLDMVSCRNLLIYLERDLQEDALRVFHYALNRNGVLLLGNAESADATAELFEPIEPKHRLYRRLDAVARHPSSLPALHLLEPTFAPGRAERGAGRPVAPHPAERHHRLLEATAPPSIVVDRAYTMTHLSESAGRFLRRPGGVPSEDVLREVLPDLRVELQEALREAFDEGRPASRGPVYLDLDGEPTRVHLMVRPDPPSDDAPVPEVALVVFVEAGPAEDVGPIDVVSAGTPGAAGGPAAARRILHLQEESKRLRERLQATIEEYESSKEEMKAANEELQSINEEHKSTAEELETSREELQSMNEELEALNRELTFKIDQLSQTNSDLQNLMAATEVGTLFLDRELRIQRFTPRISSYFHIRDSDVGRPITDLTHALEYDDLVRDAKRVLDDLVPVEREVAGPERKWQLVRLRPYRTVEDVIEGVVITFVDITRRKEAEESLRSLTNVLEQRVEERTIKLRRALDLFHDIFHASPAPIAMTRAADGRLVDANQAYRDLFGYGPQDMKDTRNLARRHWTDDRQREEVRAEVEREGRARDVEVELRTRSGETRTALVFVERVTVDGAPYELTVFIDITARKRAEQQVRALASRLTIAEQEERTRVAQVLHDDLQQRLYGARYKLEAVRHRASGNQAAVDALAPLQDVERWLDDAIEQMRRLTVDLSPPVLEGEGLQEALVWLVEQMRDVHGLEVSLKIEKTSRIRQKDQRVMVFQIVRELLFNVVKHAGVMEAEIRITEQEGSWRIEVRDEGVGFDPAVLDGNDAGGGYGLPHLRERIDLFGGRLELDTAPGQGARVRILLPMPNGAEARRIEA